MTQGLIFGLGMVLLALTGISDKIAAQPRVYPEWENGACYENGIYFPARPGPMCDSADKAIAAMTSAPPHLTYRVLPVTGLGSPVTISNAPSPKCEDGWTLVSVGRPMCARDLREPK